MTPEQQDAIKLAAQERVQYLLLLCDKIEDENAWRAHAWLKRDLIKEVRQLLGALE